jgi:putative membrane protein
MRPFSTALGILLEAATLGFSAAAWAQQGYYGYGPGMHGDWHDGWGGMIFGPIIMILFVAAIVVLVVVALRWLGGGPGPAAGPGHRHGGRSPLDILEERFAHGEIDKEEFEERRRTLRG